MRQEPLSNEELVRYLDEYGFKLVSYDGKEKVTTECIRGHIKEYSIYYVKKAKCNECSKIEVGIAVRKEVESMGYILHNEYTHSSTKLITTCPNGHERVARIDSFRKDECKKCFSERKLNDLLTRIESNGYKILEPPEDTRGFITVECSNGHVKKIKAWNLISRKCNECEQGRPVQYNIDFCRQKFAESGFELIETEYKSCKTLMNYICICGRTKETTLDTVLNGNKKYCDECKHENNTGENHWNWNNGITPLHVKERGKAPYRHWRNSVLERDNETCQCCNNQEGNLQVHHIDSYSKNEDSRYDIHNGIVLCKSCHDMYTEGSFHYTYGRHDNNIFQLQEYFDDIRSALGLPLIRIEDIVYPKELILI